MRRIVVGLTVGIVVAAGAAAITIRPASHDFGKVPVLGHGYHAFHVTLPPDTIPTDTMRASITGADKAHFNVAGLVLPTSCGGSPPGWRTGSCELQIEFLPLSVGVKTATLVLTDSRGGRATAALRGEGVAFVCEMRVVSCNYAYLYSGTFTWGIDLRAPKTTVTTSVTVNVTKGVATCSGTETTIDLESGTQTKSIGGDGLIAVEFVKDSADQLVYNVTAACPPPAAAGSSAVPAELGHTDMQSYPVRATSVGMNVVGASTYPAPEEDPVNNVTGTVSVRWSLLRW